MRAGLYKALVEKLKQYTDKEGKQVFGHFDLWNEQVDFIEEETPFETPAVFIEFRTINWNEPMQNIQRGTFPVRLHVVTEWKGGTADGNPYQDQSLERLDMVDGMAAHLFNWRHDDGTVNVQRMQRVSSHTNHNHGELVEDIEDFTCTVLCRI